MILSQFAYDELYNVELTEITKKGGKMGAFIKKWWPLVIAFIIVFGLWSASLFFALHYSTGMSLRAGIDKYGQLGDFFGIANSLFNVLAILLVILGLWIQSKDSKEARNEADKQGFENNFYNLLKIHTDIVNSAKISDRISLEKSGRECFTVLISYLRDAVFNVIKSRVEQKQEIKDEEVIQEGYNMFFRNYEQDIGHHWRRLFNIFEYIEREKSEIKKEVYGKIVRSMFTKNEILLLFFNCINYRGKGFIEYANKFRLFRSIDLVGLRFTCYKGDLLNEEMHIIKYETVISLANTKGIETKYLFEAE